MSMSKKDVPGAGKPSPQPPRDAAIYEATVPTFVNGRLYQKGEQFQSNVEKPGRTWKLVQAGRTAAPAGGKGGKKDQAAAPAAAQAPAAAPAPAGGGESPTASAEGDGEGSGRQADQSPI